jgi:hypothetical protein
LHGLLDKFKSTRNIHWLVKLQLVASAQFVLALVRIWKSKLDFDGMSKGFPPRNSKEILLKKHLKATLVPAKKMINRLLEADSGFFEDHHYLDPCYRNL